MFAVITKSNYLFMKKIQLLNWIVFAFLAFQFSACDNEPLSGQFPQEGDPGNAEEGQFKAVIDGNQFIADEVTATINLDNTLVLTGKNSVTSEVISIVAEEIAEGSFNITAGSGTLNAGVYFDDNSILNPYISFLALGGTGQLIITEYNTDDSLISGNFSIVGGRFALDDNGNPIIGGDGNPVVENVTISSGAFNSIPFIIDETGGGNGGGGNPLDEFYALVDGVEFVDTSVTTTITTIGGIEMFNIKAKTSTGALIRIDLPFDLGEGTFPMESISDGTKIIGLFNNNNGGENLTSNPGTITITDFNTEIGIIEATFEFTGTDPLQQDPTIVEVTEGSFTAHFEGIPGSGPSPFTAEIDGVLYETETIDIIQSTFIGVDVVTINTTTASNQNLGITFPKDITVGTYDMSTNLTNGQEIIAYYNPDVGNSILYRSNPGTFTVNSYDTVTGEIEGTFSFNAVDLSGQDPTVFEVTSGSFILTIQ